MCVCLLPACALVHFYVLLHLPPSLAVVWYIFREIYTTDGTPDVCRYVVVCYRFHDSLTVESNETADI